MKRWALVAFAFPCIAGAQSVRGTVLEQASQRPLAGAVIFLIDATQTVVARDLTGEDGGYRLTAPRPGSYRVRMMRIGFRPVLSDVVRLGDGEDVTLPLTVESVPVSLSAVRVDRRANCPVREDATQAYNAWNEVATALNAALLSSRMRGTSATIVGYDRWTEPGSDVVLRQGARVDTSARGQPWRSISAESLHVVGFVVEEPSGWFTFHALDLEVLLSDRFLEDHCLRYDGVKNGQIAIEFTPSRDRSRIAEVRGFVWLDAATLELKRVQFRYVNIMQHYERADAGGELEFFRLRNGSWIISKWQIRMPTAFAQGRSDSYGGLKGTPDIRATEVKTTGGEVLRVVQNGDTVFSLPPRDLQGRVLDSASGRPVRGARVVVVGTEQSDTTDQSGRFRIGNVLAGAYMLGVHTPALDSIAAFHQSSAIVSAEFSTIELRLPSVAAVAAQLCSAIRRNERSASGALPGMLTGVVTAPGATPVSGATITVEWNDFAISAAGVSQRPRSIIATTDSRGVYRVCGVPTEHLLMLSTEFDGDAFPTQLRIETDSKVRRYDIALDANRKRITQRR